MIVTNVVDGDTVGLNDGRQVRLLGIDAPERNDCGFAEATRFARTTLLNQEVTVASDPTQDSVDRHGRTLLYVGTPDDYSIAVARQGWAKRYVFNHNPVQKDPQIRAAELAAQAERAGLWGAHCAPPPDSTTRQAAPAAQDDNSDDVRPLAAAPDRKPRPEQTPDPAPAAESAPEPAPTSNCHPSYSPCVPEGPDLDCADIGHPVKVVGPDEYRLDGDDNDGKGCESYS